MTDNDLRRDDLGPAPTLHGERVRLRPPKPSDVDDLLALGRHPQIVRAYGASYDGRQFRRADLEAWYAGLQRHAHAWVVEHDGRAVGEVRLDDFDRLHRFAEVIVVLTDPEVLGSGLAGEALELVVGYAFDKLGLHRLSMREMEYNEPALETAREAGFVVEGRERETAQVDGEWYGVVMLGLLVHEWQAHQAA